MMSAVRALLVAAGLTLVLAPAAGAAEYPENTNSWVYDIAGVIDDPTEAEIVRLFQALEAETAVDAVAVAISSVDDYDPGATIEDFATDLFNHFGIGDAGIDDGVLLLVAVDDRQARVVIGDGFADSYVDEAQQVIDAMLSSFRESRYGDGILTGAREITARFRALGDGSAGGGDAALSPSGGGLAERLVGVLGGADGPAGEETGGGIPSAVWYALGGGGAALFGAGGFVTWQRIKPRRCAECNREMKRIKGREAERPLLGEGQNLEEELDSVEYDVYECTSCGAHRIERHGKLFSSYKACPKCSFKTMRTSRQTVTAATYDHGGVDRVIEDCEHCEYHDEREVSTPKKRRPSSGSRSSSRSGRDRSGPSGGGRSSGRGASGSW